MGNLKKYFENNLKRWNELVDINVKSKFYDLEGFISGKTSLLPIEIEELGNVEGKTLLHLQCHFGMDSLSWARKGAIVTGIDFSDKAISFAKQLSKKLKLPAKFLRSNIYDIPEIIHKKYNIVFTSYGVICWLPDLYKWAKLIDYCLKPGGIFYIIDNHPFGILIDENKPPFEISYNYFTKGEPVHWNDSDTYAGEDVELKNKSCFEWFHKMSDIINSLIQVNLKIEYLHEFPYGFFGLHPDMKKRDDRLWEFQTLKYSVPMMFSIKAHK